MDPLQRLRESRLAETARLKMDSQIGLSRERAVELEWRIRRAEHRLSEQVTLLRLPTRL